MMNKRNTATLTRQRESALATNKVLRNTYLLLGMTFLFSALMAYISFAIKAPPVHPLFFIVGTYGLMFLTHALRNSPFGILSVFAFTGFMGFAIGPILNAYITSFSNGPQLIGTALGGTGLIFLSLSGYALSTQKDFSYLNGFLFVAVMVALLGMIAGVFFQIPALQLMISAVFVLISLPEFFLAFFITILKSTLSCLLFFLIFVDRKICLSVSTQPLNFRHLRCLEAFPRRFK